VYYFGFLLDEGNRVSDVTAKLRAWRKGDWRFARASLARRLSEATPMQKQPSNRT
jgi:hypothetical protein